MPNPQIRPTRTVNGETREWDGSQWVPSGGTAAPALPMANVPRGTFTPEQVKSNVDQGNWLLKNLLMTGGMIAGGAATGGVAPMIAGAALGRMAGHVPEAEVARFRGDDPSTYSVGSYLDEGAQGAMEGAAGEAQSRAVGPALKYGGKFGQWLGKIAGDVPGMEPRWRAGMGMSRAGLTHLIGGGPGLASVAAVGPMVASELGKRAERAGTAMMTRPGLAEGLGGAWEALKERLNPSTALTHAERLAAGAEDFAGERAAQAAQQAARERASGLAPDLGERATVRMRTPEPAVGFEPAPAGAGDFPTNAELVRKARTEPPWLDQYAIDPAEYRPPSPAGSADALADRVRRTPQGFDVDLTGPTVVGGPEAPAAAPTGAATPSVTPPASDLAANLTPDELVEHYQTNYPAQEPWIATGGGTRSGLVPNRPLKGVVADPSIRPPATKEDFLDALRQSLLLGKRLR